jgi:hypothetical protein
MTSLPDRIASMKKETQALQAKLSRLEKQILRGKEFWVGEEAASRALEELRTVAHHHPQEFSRRLETLDQEAQIAGERRQDPSRMLNVLLNESSSPERTLPLDLRRSFVDYMTHQIGAILRDRPTKIPVRTPNGIETQSRRRVLILPEDWTERVMLSL